MKSKYSDITTMFEVPQPGRSLPRPPYAPGSDFGWGGSWGHL